MNANNFLTAEVENLQRELAERSEAKKSEVLKNKVELKIVQDYAEALETEKSNLIAKLKYCEEL